MSFFLIENNDRMPSAPVEKSSDPHPLDLLVVSFPRYVLRVSPITGFWQFSLV